MGLSPERETVGPFRLSELLASDRMKAKVFVSLGLCEPPGTGAGKGDTGPHLGAGGPGAEHPSVSPRSQETEALSGPSTLDGQLGPPLPGKGPLPTLSPY